MLALVCLGIPGEHAAILNGSQLVTQADRSGFLAEALFQQEQVLSAPIMRGAKWTDTGPTGVKVTVQADAVSRQPRKVGPFTLESFQEIVASRLLVRVADQGDRVARNHKSNVAFEAFRQLQRRLVGFYAMANGGLHSELDPTHLSTQSVLGGVVLEDLVFEMVRDSRAGRLRIQTMSTAQDGLGWILQGVQVEATDGRRLTIDEAIWNENGRLIASGPYSLEDNRKRTGGSRGCFFVRLGAAVEIRQPIHGDMDAALCVLNPLLIRDSIELPAIPTPFSGGAEAWPSLQMAHLVKKLPFPALPQTLLQTPRGQRGDRLKRSDCCSS